MEILYEEWHKEHSLWSEVYHVLLYMLETLVDVDRITIVDNHKYTYNKKGLLKQEKQTRKSAADKDTTATTYKYSGLALKSAAVKWNGKTITKITYKANGKGWVTQEKYKGESGTSTYTCKYNKKGLITKRAGEYNTMTYTYDSKGRLKSLKEVFKPQGKYTMKFKYDKKGNFKKELTDGSVSVKYANTYKKGRLVKRVATVPNNEFDSKYTVTYTYKKVSVPQSAATMVKGQQQALINGKPPVTAMHK